MKQLASNNTTAHKHAALWCAAIVTTLCGCGSSELPLAEVQGSVTYQGRPLKHGRVVFTPQKGTAGPQSVGEIEANGEFRMRTANQHGAPLGKHVVTVHCRRPPTDAERAKLVTTELLVPAQYARQDKTPLEFEVKDERNEFEIVLK